MTIQHTTLFPLGYPLIARYVFTAPGAFSVTAPAPPNFLQGATYVRAGVNAAGGFQDQAAGWGGGASFAFAGEACTPGEVFTGQVGDSQHSRPSADDVLGDGWIKRPDSSLLVYSDRGRWNGNPGLAANSTGTIKRDGSAATASAGGASAGDDGDTYPLGFGGPGATTTAAPWYGGGGGYQAISGNPWPQFPAADGRNVIEFYLVNPGYD